MEKHYETDGCTEEQLLGGSQTTTMWRSLNRNNGRLKQAVRMMGFLTVVMGIVLVAFVHLTIQMGKERDLVLHLEQQIHEFEHHGNTVTKRAIPWFLGAAFWVTNQVFAFYGLATSCKSFTESRLDAATCIWGAISTAATFIGVAQHGASTVKIIHDKLAQNSISIGWKRNEMIFEAESQLSELFKLPFTLDGFIPHHHPRIARMKLANGTMWPVFHMYNHHNTSMHFTMTAYEEDHAVMSFGFGHKSDPNTIGKRETYQDEYFTNGGIDFTDCFNDSQNTYLLNTDADYQQMDRDVQCYYPDLANTWGAEIQIYDSNVEGTIGSGSIAAFRGSDHASSASVMPGCPAGLSASDKCRSA
ncbi:hypothetical protein P153DRAFT_361992 [Dothidotthia symphoricarpi CBS 119687]|uniref:Uncharacterized protein n=1 Tax=Dothidotthia symphoricarpi CBS 119687 TaxID=1392245 RepID=A0A6A5ZWL5_9PLEO|nr:uncharacterized protein P153DRAFT_361992 [Dothidotthia symphoricarpi CBS 119687]KAF2123425.1 hypothetical protein P153DRAFT_361992 [Dothidotthia symphoricarpi CBS 119687]